MKYWALMRSSFPNLIFGARDFHFCKALCQKLVQFRLSDIGEGIAEVQIKEWFVKPGDRINEFDNVCEVQSDKASVTITSRYTGLVKRLHHKIDDIAKLGQPLVDIELEGQTDVEEVTKDTKISSPDAATSSQTSAVEVDSSSELSKKILATPAVRRIAKEHDVDLQNIKATGKDGRILKEDVLNFIGLTAPESIPLAESATEIFRENELSKERRQHEDKTVAIRGYMRSMLKAMTATTQIPHFGYGDEICVDRLVDLREQMKSKATKLGIKMSYMPFFIKAASLALHHFPILNSSLDSNSESLTYKAAHNICVAMDTADGLVVPNVKNCESKNLWQIASELNRLHEDAKKGQLSKEDLSHGTFTLSNIGSIGGTYAHPVIFPPQVVIGALGKIKVVPRFDSAKQNIKPTMVVNVSWSADHRVIDGATMARFCNLWKQYLENPALMIADMK